MVDEIPYSRIDRLLHNLAFGNNGIQTLMADIEGALYGSDWKDIEIRQPIFITSLPRAGTTIMLEVLSRLPCCVTHTYRNMPFLLSPFLWEKISGNFRTTGKEQERAHGDGLMITEDSPEAFEEILWKKLYPEKYTSDRISLWEKPDLKESFHIAFVQHIKKILALAHRASGSEIRYLSKNNANISRINIIRDYFPDAHIVVPFRDPVSHAVSMHRQHLNFLEMHSNNKFVEKYMGDIGHFEFGKLHRPIAFEKPDSDESSYDKITLEYWLEYWKRAFNHVADMEGVIFVSYERFANSDRDDMLRVTNKLNIKVKNLLLDNLLDMLKPIRKYEYTGDERQLELVEDCNKLYKRLEARCLLV